MAGAAPTAAFAPVPIIDPDAFENFEGLRETTLAYFTDSQANATMRAFVDFVFTLALDYSRYWPREPEGFIVHQCRAATADLRYLQGFLAMLHEQRFDANLDDREARIATACGRLSERVKKIADALEKLLVPQSGEEEAE